MPHHRPHGPRTAGRVIHWARYYDAVAWLMSFGRAPAIRKKTVELAGVAPGEKVLDVGCGTGALAIAAKAKAGPSGHVSGIDPSPEMIEVARRKAARAGLEMDFRVAAIEELPFPDGSFDLVLSSLMLHHLPDDVKRVGLAEVRRVLKPGGRFLAVDLATSGHSFFGHLVAAVTGHGREHGVSDQVAAMAREAGFADVETGQTEFGPLWFIRAKAAGAARRAALG